MTQDIITLSGDLDADYILLNQKVFEVSGKLKFRDMNSTIQKLNEKFNINIGCVDFETYSEYDDEGGTDKCVSFHSVYIRLEDREDLVDLQDISSDDDSEEIEKYPHLADVDYDEIKDILSDDLDSHGEYLYNTSYEQIIGSKEAGYEYAN